MSSTVAETLSHTAPAHNPTAVVDSLASKLPSELFQRPTAFTPIREAAVPRHRGRYPLASHRPGRRIPGPRMGRQVPFL